MSISFPVNVAIVGSFVLFLVWRFMVLRGVQKDIRVMIEEKDFDRAHASLKRARRYLRFGGSGYGMLNTDIYLSEARCKTEKNTFFENRAERAAFRLEEAIQRDREV